MIRRLRYHEIYFEKYDKCVENSSQRTFYAQKEILDFLCESWELLVLNDYQAVMPVPVKKKFGFRFVIQPLFCQQLGIFSDIDDKKTNSDFLEFFKKHYRIYYYAFNASNQFLQEITTRKNYLIKSQTYEILRKQYFKGRKSTVKNAQFHNFRELDADQETFDFILKNLKGLEKKSDISKLNSYLHFLSKKNYLKLYGSFFKDTLTNIAVVINKNATLHLLMLTNHPDFLKNNGASFLIDQILQENIQHSNLDFMGGNIRSIEIFFKSFGSMEKSYSTIQFSLISVLKNFFK